MSTPLRIPSIALLALLLMAAIPRLAGAQTLGSVSSPLSTGATTVSTQQQANLGLLALSTALRGSGSAVSCSGVLLANDWALTAGHCVDVLAGKVTTVTATFVVGSYTADAIYKFGQGMTDPAGPDIALVHLATPIVMNGSTHGYAARLWSGSLSGKTVAVFGRSQAIGYTAADMKVTREKGLYLSLADSSAGATTAEGDSGGPGFIWDGGVPYIVGTVSTTNGNLTSIPASRTRILAVTRSKWTPDSSISHVQVDRDEVNVTAWSFAPYANSLDQVPWAVAQRAATQLCMSRGMAGGHFDGEQSGSTFSLFCSRRTNVPWRDALQVQVDGTGWGFTDINAVSWARANRAAERLCAQANAGYSGGHFSGDQSPEGKGLFCFGGNAHWFDSTDSTRAAAGGPIGDLDSATWTNAARAAGRFCRANGAATGFFNGQQVGDKRGVVCLR